jgi:hypothetical protein
MRRLAFVVALLLGSLPAGAAELPRIEDDPFLRSYVQELERLTPARTLERIRGLPEDRLLALHRDYGMWIRNKWLWGNRDPKLLAFFRAKGMDDPDDMSPVLIRALWRDLDRRLPVARRSAIERKRALIARKHALYLTLSHQCSEQLSSHLDAFAACQAEIAGTVGAGVAARLRFEFVLAPTGAVKEVTVWPPLATSCVERLVDGFTFAPFDTDPMLTLAMVSPPLCRVGELDRLFE